MTGERRNDHETAPQLPLWAGVAIFINVLVGRSGQRRSGCRVWWAGGRGGQGKVAPEGGGGGGEAMGGGAK